MTHPPSGPSNPPPPSGPGKRVRVDQLLTVADAAGLLRVSPKSIYRLVWAGTLTTVDVGTGTKKPRTRIKQAELQRYIDSREE